MVFCRVMHHYHMTHRETLNLPIRAFWFMNASLNRIFAEMDLRSMDVAAGTQSGENFEIVRKGLLKEQGVLMVEVPELDSKGLAELKDMQ